MGEERRGVHERLEDEGTGDEFSKRGKVNIRYTIASLLEFNEGEACRKLPGDFNVLLLRELDGATECEKISCNTYGSFPLTRWDLGFPSERHGNNLFTLSNDSSLRRNCNLERKSILCQPLLSEVECSAGILGPKIQRNDLFQLKKSQNPYRPPHCIKKVPKPLDTSSEHQVEWSANSSFSGTETNHGSLVETDSVNSSLDSWSHNKGSGNIDALLRSRTTCHDDDDHLFDDFWAEILEIVQQQRDLKLLPDVAQDDVPDSNAETTLHRKNSLVSAEGSEDFIKLDNDHLAKSEWEFNLPDEDSLITIDDLMLVPPSPAPAPALALDSNSADAVKMTQNAAVNFRQNSEYVHITKPDDRYSAGSTSGLVGRGQLAHSRCPEKSSLHSRNDHQMGLLSNFMTPNAIPYLPILDWYPCSDFHQGGDRESILTRTGTNHSLFQYSLWQQPSISPDQLSHFLIDTLPVATPDLSATQFLQLTPQQATFQGFGMSNKGGFGDKGMSSFWRNQQ